jgi:hypothetical protein
MIQEAQIHADPTVRIRIHNNACEFVAGVAHSLFVENRKVHYWYAGTVWNLPRFKRKTSSFKLRSIIS